MIQAYGIITNFAKRRKKPEIYLSQCKRVLVIVQGAWGDTTMMIPFFKLLRQHCENAEIISLCNTKIAESNLSQLNLINEIIRIPKEISGGKNMLRYPLAVRRFVKKINTVQPFDLAICLSPSLGTGILLRVIKANVYVAFCNSLYKVFFDYSINWDIKSHYTDKFLYVLERLGCIVQYSQRIPQINITDEDLQNGNSFVFRNKINNKYIIGIGIGASCMTRKWTQFGQLIAGLNQKENIVILLFDGSTETEEINDIISKALFPERLFHISCEIGQLKSYISICNLIIGNDSGFSHYGAACGIDTIQIRGCVKGDRTGARGNGKVIILENDRLECRGKEESICPKGTYECLASITVEQVERVVMELVYNYENQKNSY